ncbi:hypothetical protein D3C71_423390 [compost metagenome]
MLKCFSISGTMPRSMAAASVSLGSSTFTTWKRRASAASFSKYFLYSPQVVAAMVRSSPRASAGLSRLAASLCPAWPPAPIMVWASSMKSTIGCGLFFTSAITFFRRFSNSPFTLAPACSRPMSSVCSATARSDSGTSCAAMRSASPSTTAVLPTPASPVRMGLFWRRRIRMSMTWRISVSRPMTGSSAPSFARCVRLVVNWSSAGVLPGTPAASGSAGACCASPSVAAPDAPASAASLDPSVSLSKSCFRSSRRILAKSGEPRCASCARSGWVSSASSRWPERICAACASSEASSHACWNSCCRCCENTGVRVLPFLKVWISRSRSDWIAVALMRLARSTRARSLSVCSSSARNRCSRSTS